MKTVLKGRIIGIALSPRIQAEYKVESEATIPFFYFTFKTDRGSYELEDKVIITVEKEEEEKE